MGNNDGGGGSSSSRVRPKLSLPATLLVSGVSVATATCVTSPIDMVKTRMQLTARAVSSGASSTPERRAGMLSTMGRVVRTEGAGALWAGLTPAVARGLTYGGLRLGLYQPLKDRLRQGSQHHAPHAGAWHVPPAAADITAGMAAGGFAAALTSPTELIKTRLQAQQRATGSAGKPSAGTGGGVVAVTRQVLSERGVAGLWAGAVPGVVRAALLNGSQCATYDAAKRAVTTRFGWSGEDGATQVACALVTGLISTTITNPADVVKTHMYVASAAKPTKLPGAEAPSNTRATRHSSDGAWATARRLVAADGPGALMKGWTANYARLGPQTLVTFLVAERLRALVGAAGL